VARTIFEPVPATHGADVSAMEDTHRVELDLSDSDSAGSGRLGHFPNINKNLGHKVSQLLSRAFAAVSDGKKHLSRPLGSCEPDCNHSLPYCGAAQSVAVLWVGA
jgi:hypothetical protein